MPILLMLMPRALNMQERVEIAPGSSTISTVKEYSGATEPRGPSGMELR